MSSFPFKFEDLDKETNDAIKKDFQGFTRGMMRVTPYGLCVPPAFQDYLEKIYNMEVRHDDTWIVTYPKTGTTWTSAAIWSLFHDGRLDLLKENPDLDDWRFLDMDPAVKDGNARLIAENRIPEQYLSMFTTTTDQLDRAMNDPRDTPRLIKSHLPLSFLPPNLLDTAKVVYIVRNPRDTCVSYYHHHCFSLAMDYVGTFEKFFDYFLKDLILYSPYWPNVIEAWNKRHHPNMLFMFYEDMKKDFGAALRKLAVFLNKPVSEELVEKLLVELSFEGMKKNPVYNAEIAKDMGVARQDGNFIRKGVVGDWKNYFTPEMTKRMDEWSKKARQGCDIKFPGEEDM